MSNKGSDNNVGSIEKISQTSDKNVAKVTKSDIDILNALIYVYEARLPNYNELMDSEVKSLKNILAEREQDKKRIQELETKLKCSKDLYDDCCKCLLDSIPKQAIIDKIKELEKLVYEIQKSETCEEYPCGEDIIYRIQIDILQELLEGERK